MEPPNSGAVELPFAQALGLHSSQPESIPHYIIAAQEITAERDSRLGTTKSTGSVFKGFWNNSLVAVKILSNGTPVDILLDRIQRWQILRHPHVLQVFGVSILDAHQPLIISQHYPNGNANEFLRKNPTADRAKIMFECALGMQYLHGRGLIHGGLKPTNILVANNGQACIADYGMVEIMPTRSACARYFSPEAWKGTISKPSDVFAFAMSSYEIFTSTPPWGVLSENHIYQLVVREGDRPDRLEPNIEQKYGLTDEIWGIMAVAWQKEATLRPTFTQIVDLWQMRRALQTLRPISPSTSITASSSGQSLGDSQSTLDSIQTWRYHLNSDSRSRANMPPAYRDVSVRRPQFSGAFSTSGGRSNDQTRNTEPHIRSITESDSRQFSPPQSSASRSGTEDSPSPLTSTVPNTTPLNSSPSLHQMHRSPLVSVSTIHSSELPRMPPIDEAGLVSPNVEYRAHGLQPQSSANTLGRNPAYIQDQCWLDDRRIASQAGCMMEVQSARSESQPGASNISGTSNVVLIAGALHAEVTEGRKQELIDNYLRTAQFISSQSDKVAQKLVTAGIVPTVILLLKARAVDADGLEIVLVTLGILACDPITANTIHRTNTTSTLIAIINSTDSNDIVALSVWCINRICRSPEVAASLVKQGLAEILIRKGLSGSFISSRFSAWCLGILAYTDDLAQTLAALNTVNISVEHLHRVTANLNAEPEDICAAIYFVARLARSTSLSKSLARAGCVPLIVHHMSTSGNPQILHWSARAVGCLQRPNASDIAKALLDAGSARALARLPRVLPSEVTEPLASFAFAIQRLSCAEWGGGTRKALVEGGVVDSLLSALRTSADIPCPQVHIELALATSFLGDVGGTSIRKEIVRAGGIEILKRVGAAGKLEVTKVCNMAITSITGNIWTRNAASAKTAMSHNWSGGCPEYQPACPLA